MLPQRSKWTLSVVKIYSHFSWRMDAQLLNTLRCESGRQGIGLQTCWPTTVTLFTPPPSPLRSLPAQWWRHGSQLIPAPRINVLIAREGAQSISEEHVCHWGNSPWNWVNGLLRSKSPSSWSYVCRWTCSLKHRTLLNTSIRGMTAWFILGMLGLNLGYTLEYPCWRYL